MTAVWMVQVAVNEEIDMVSVRDRFVAAAAVVNVPGWVSATLVRRSTGSRVDTPDRQHVFFDCPTGFRVVQVAVVQVIDMAVVLDSRVPTAGAVLMRVAGMSVRRAHGNSSFVWLNHCRRGQRVGNS